MTESKNVAIVEEQNEIITLQNRQFKALVAGGFLPKGCSENEGFARIVAGSQLGMKPIQALNGIAMINGHPTLHSDSIPCVVMSSGLVNGMHYKFSGDGETLACTFYIRRKGIEEYQEWTYSMADAKAAGLLKNPVWQSHPKKMLFNRARTWCMRNTFPDVIGNIYTNDEIDETDTKTPVRAELEEIPLEDRYTPVELDPKDNSQNSDNQDPNTTNGAEDDWTLDPQDVSG